MSILLVNMLGILQVFMAFLKGIIERTLGTYFVILPISLFSLVAYQGISIISSLKMIRWAIVIIPTSLFRDAGKLFLTITSMISPMKGYKYTWARRKGNLSAIEEKLDKGLATYDQLDIFPHFHRFNSVTSRPDHSPLL